MQKLTLNKPLTMKRLLPIALFLAAFFTNRHAIAQDNQSSEYSVKPYGYAAYEIIMDTRKSVDTRNGELFLYPKKAELDAFGNDINKKFQLQMVSIISRIGLKLAGPDVLGAKTTGIIETDFFATATNYAYLLRLRHAMIKLRWESSELLLGQYWHPIIATEMIPSTLGFGAGTPFHSLNRSPQIRYTRFMDNIRLTAAALMQGYHISSGPTDAQRNSGLPEILLQGVYGSKEQFMMGISAGYKWLTPRLVTASGVATDKTVGQYVIGAFSLYKIAGTTLRAEVVYGQNLTNLIMIGGYGMETGTDNPANDYDYTSLRTLSTWFEAKKSIQQYNVGVFAGLSKLMGADKNYTTIPGYNRSDDIDYLWRIAPRITYTQNKLTFGMEYMLTAAVYGTGFDAKHKVTSSDDAVFNNRISFIAKYSF